MNTTLKQQEQIIAGAMAKPFEIGRALRTIRDEKLYKETHDSFEGYVSERWKITKSGAYQKIKCADVFDIISQSKLPALDNEAQATELARLKIEKSSKLDEKSIKLIWKKATSHKDRPATQAAIRELITLHLGKDEDNQPWYQTQLNAIKKDIAKFKDRLNKEADTEIPQSVLNEFGSIMDEMEALKAEFESLATRTDEAGQVSDD